MKPVLFILLLLLTTSQSISALSPKSMIESSLQAKKLNLLKYSLGTLNESDMTAAKKFWDKYNEFNVEFEKGSLESDFDLLMKAFWSKEYKKNPIYPAKWDGCTARDLIETILRLVENGKNKFGGKCGTNIFWVVTDACLKFMNQKDVKYLSFEEWTVFSGHWLEELWNQKRGLSALLIKLGIRTAMNEGIEVVKIVEELKIIKDKEGILWTILHELIMEYRLLKRRNQPAKVYFDSVAQTIIALNSQKSDESLAPGGKKLDNLLGALLYCFGPIDDLSEYHNALERYLNAFIPALNDPMHLDITICVMESWIDQIKENQSWDILNSSLVGVLNRLSATFPGNERIWYLESLVARLQGTEDIFDQKQSDILNSPLSEEYRYVLLRDKMTFLMDSSKNEMKIPDFASRPSTIKIKHTLTGLMMQESSLDSFQMYSHCLKSLFNFFKNQNYLAYLFQAVETIDVKKISISGLENYLNLLLKEGMVFDVSRWSQILDEKLFLVAKEHTRYRDLWLLRYQLYQKEEGIVFEEEKENELYVKEQDILDRLYQFNSTDLRVLRERALFYEQKKIGGSWREIAIDMWEKILRENENDLDAMVRLQSFAMENPGKRKAVSLAKIIFRKYYSSLNRGDQSKLFSLLSISIDMDEFLNIIVEIRRESLGRNPHLDIDYAVATGMWVSQVIRRGLSDETVVAKIEKAKSAIEFLGGNAFFNKELQALQYLYERKYDLALGLYKELKKTSNDSSFMIKLIEYGFLGVLEKKFIASKDQNVLQEAMSLLDKMKEDYVKEDSNWDDSWSKGKWRYWKGRFLQLSSGDLKREEVLGLWRKAFETNAYNDFVFLEQWMQELFQEKKYKEILRVYTKACFRGVHFPKNFLFKYEFLEHMDVEVGISYLNELKELDEHSWDDEICYLFVSMYDSLIDKRNRGDDNNTLVEVYEVIGVLDTVEDDSDIRKDLLHARVRINIIDEERFEQTFRKKVLEKALEYYYKIFDEDYDYLKESAFDWEESHRLEKQALDWKVGHRFLVPIETDFEYGLEHWFYGDYDLARLIWTKGVAKTATTDADRNNIEKMRVGICFLDILDDPEMSHPNVIANIVDILKNCFRGNFKEGNLNFWMNIMSDVREMKRIPADMTSIHKEFMNSLTSLKPSEVVDVELSKRIGTWIFDQITEEDVQNYSTGIETLKLTLSEQWGVAPERLLTFYRERNDWESARKILNQYVFEKNYRDKFLLEERVEVYRYVQLHVNKFSKKEINDWIAFESLVDEREKDYLLMKVALIQRWFYLLKTKDMKTNTSSLKKKQLDEFVKTSQWNEVRFNALKVRVEFFQKSRDDRGLLVYLDNCKKYDWIKNNSLCLTYIDNIKQEINERAMKELQSKQVIREEREKAKVNKKIAAELERIRLAEEEEKRVKAAAEAEKLRVAKEEEDRAKVEKRRRRYEARQKKKKLEKVQKAEAARIAKETEDQRIEAERRAKEAEDQRIEAARIAKEAEDQRIEAARRAKEREQISLEYQALENVVKQKDDYVENGSMGEYYRALKARLLEGAENIEKLGSIADLEQFYRKSLEHLPNDLNIRLKLARLIKDDQAQKSIELLSDAEAFYNRITVKDAAVIEIYREITRLKKELNQDLRSQAKIDTAA